MISEGKDTNRRKVLKSMGGAVAAGGGLAATASKAEAAEDCGSYPGSRCDPGETCAHGADVYDACYTDEGEFTGTSLAGFVCVEILEECKGVWPWDPVWIKIDYLDHTNGADGWIKKSELASCSSCS